MLRLRDSAGHRRSVTQSGRVGADPGALGACIRCGTRAARNVSRTIVGVRPSLSGGLVLEVSGLPNAQMPEEERALSELLRQPVRLVAVAVQSSYGGLGRPRGGGGGDLAEQALVRLRTGSPSLPGGYPRIGTRVETSQGIGTVVSVRTRNRTVLVQVGDETVRLSLEELRMSER